jgi:Ca-dependent carbohydrate-binding module xylan-binding
LRPEAGSIRHSGQSDAVTVRGDWSEGNHTVQVNFLNDAYGGTATTDRNLYVDEATYNGSAVAGA